MCYLWCHKYSSIEKLSCWVSFKGLYAVVSVSKAVDNRCQRLANFAQSLPLSLVTSATKAVKYSSNCPINNFSKANKCCHIFVICGALQHLERAEIYRNHCEDESMRVMQHLVNEVKPKSTIKIYDLYLIHRSRINSVHLNSFNLVCLPPYGRRHPSDLNCACFIHCVVFHSWSCHHGTSVDAVMSFFRN